MCPAVNSIIQDTRNLEVFWSQTAPLPSTIGHQQQCTQATGLDELKSEYHEERRWAGKHAKAGIRNLGKGWSEMASAHEKTDNNIGLKWINLQPGRSWRGADEDMENFRVAADRAVDSPLKYFLGEMGAANSF
jgi:hypothetical protein